MATNHISVHTDSELKAKAQLILSELGLDMSTAINVFLQQVVFDILPALKVRGFLLQDAHVRAHTSPSHKDIPIP